MLTYRTAQPADARLYFEWANDPETRHQSFHSDLISLETHTAWFTRKIADPNSLLLLFSNEAGQPVGQVRFERAPIADMPDEIIIGIAVDAKHRGQGLAAQLIQLGCASCRKRWGVVTIHAYIKPDNQASVRAFEQAGFRLSGECGKFGVSSQATVSYDRPCLLYVNSQ
ncbi:GNAT family N-acetyltransferase [Spirosoma areae]